MQPLTQEYTIDEGLLPLFRFHQAGGVGAVMRPGRCGPRGEDAIFMDIQKGVFAVADGAGRASGASQRLMTLFGHTMTHLGGMDWALMHPESDLPSLLVPCHINSVYYFGNLTFEAADFQAASAKGSSWLRTVSIKRP